MRNFKSTLVGMCLAVSSLGLTVFSALTASITIPIGLNPGDQWCLCALRWVEALQAGCAPRIVLAATHVSMLEHTELDALKAHAID